MLGKFYNTIGIRFSKTSKSTWCDLMISLTYGLLKFKFKYISLPLVWIDVWQDITSKHYKNKQAKVGYTKYIREKKTLYSSEYGGKLLD